MWVWESRYFQANKDDILVRCKIRATFAPPTFEDKKKGCKRTTMVLDLILWGNLYPEHMRETATYRKQIGIPPRPVWPLGTNTQQWYGVLLPRYHLYQERKREITRTKQIRIPLRHACPIIWYWRQIVCYSEISNYSFHFRRLRTYLYGIRTETDYTYSDTYYTVTGCFLNS